MAVTVGENAPDIALAASTEDLISLERYRGEKPVVLLFFPLAFSPVCTSELIAMRDDYESFEEIGAEVMAISVDSHFTLKAWAEQLELQFPLLSDFNKEASCEFGTLYEDYYGMKGVSKRAAFVIDVDGTVRYRWVSEDSGQLPPFDDIKEALKKATT